MRRALSLAVLILGFAACSSSSTGLAGEITIHALDGVHLRNRAAITTSAPKSSGGNVNVVARTVVDLLRSRITASALQMHPSALVFLDDEGASKLKMRDYYEWIQKNKPGAPRV